MRQKIFGVILISLTLFFTVQSFPQNQPPPEFATCAACHTVGKGKLIGPDLKGVNDRHDEAWLISFVKSSQTMIKNGDPAAVKLFEENNKIPMPDNNLTDDQIKGILTYIKNYDQAAVTPTQSEKPAQIAEPAQEERSSLKMHKRIYGPGNTQATFIIFIILFLVSIIDLAFTRLIRAKFIHIVVLLVSVFVVGEIVYVEAKQLGRQQGYSPDQPVLFSHKIHATQNQINCLYCHSTAMNSKSAGFPGTGVCMNCHNVVRKGKVTGETEISKVIQSWNSGKPIEWVKVHNLPDHVWFSHAQHVNTGKRQCLECHGKVEEMDKIVQVESLGMGWCVSCHRTTQVQFKENPFYRDFTHFDEEIKSGNRSQVTVDDIGGNNCQLCHY
jgi:mono/diheme cytochrome c family protein